MAPNLTRRRFLKTGAAAGISVGLGSTLLDGMLAPGTAHAAEPPGLAAITGADAYANTLAAIERLGGMARFVPKGSRVAINANTAFRHPGSIVDPAVTLAVLALCLQAGATQVTLLKQVPDGYWKRRGLATAHPELPEILAATGFSDEEHRTVPIKGAKALKEADVNTAYLDADVCLNVAVAKNHKGSGYTGALKNTMGASPHEPTCRFCHVGAKEDGGWYDNLDHLSQCIADLNLVRTPDLCILDATEYLATNGPSGPGDLRRSDTVVAGADPVAIDTYGTRFLDVDPSKIGMIARSAAHGIGSSDLAKIRIEEGQSA